MGAATGAAAWFVIHRNNINSKTDYLEQASEELQKDLKERGYYPELFIVFIIILLAILPILCLIK